MKGRLKSIADRGVTLLRDTPWLLPLDATKPLRVLLVALSSDADPNPGETIEPEIRPRVDSLKVLRADTQYSTVSALKLPPPDTYDVAIAALFVRVADRKGDVGFPEDQRAFVNQLLAAEKPTVIASFGSPYLIERFPNAKTWLAEFSTNDVSQRAAVRAMFGQVAISGKIPVTVPGTVQRGDGLSVAANPMTLQPAPATMTEHLKPAYALLDRAVADGAFPGGVLAVGLEWPACRAPVWQARARWRSLRRGRRLDVRRRFADEADRHHDGRDAARAARPPRFEPTSRKLFARFRGRGKVRSESGVARARHSAHAACCTIRGFPITAIFTRTRRATTRFWPACSPNRSSASPARRSYTRTSDSSCSAKSSSG